MRLVTPIVPYLTTQLEQARAILFTGAGFSADAMNLVGEPVPTAGGLKDELWRICFPDTPVDPDSNLQTVFEAAVLRYPGHVQAKLTALLSVDATKLPGWYRFYFALPWHKCYTLNIDNLATQVASKCWLPRKIEAVSAVRDVLANVSSDKDTLRIVHMNGTIQDLPRDVTFSTTQYAERLAREEPIYTQLVAELLSYPFVFVGTKLDEPPLWLHIQLRAKRGTNLGELRPKSFLVTPKLDKAREVYLSQHNVEWLQMTAEQFANDVLSKLEPTVQKGISALSRRSLGLEAWDAAIPEVSSLATKPGLKTEFLLGTEPVWADIQSGRAVVRECDEHVCVTASDALTKKGVRGILLVTGTAGSGKSTALMRICLTLSSAGVRVGWVDREADASLRGIRVYLTREDAPPVLAIDDADILGADLASLAREVCMAAPYPLLLLAIRSGRVDAALNPAQLGKTPMQEFTMPLLTDGDIDGLIESLTVDNKLGALRGKTPLEQVEVFKEKCGRELLVAMIEATSGERFEVKACGEYDQLDPVKRRLYGLIAVASALRFSISKKDILIAAGSQDNTTLNALDQLARRSIVVLCADSGQRYRARHRVIGDIVMRRLQNTGELFDILRGLIVALASQFSPDTPRWSKPYKLLVRLIHNEFLHWLLGPEQARNLYSEIEVYLKDEAHYWLQRGVLEVEAGNLRLAKNFLDQAKGINPDDTYVDTEYALLLFRTALENPSDLNAPAKVAEAVSLLEHQIALRGKSTPYPYHVYGSQSLAWVRKGISGFEAQKAFLERAIQIVKEGTANHPTVDMVKSVLKALEDERLALVLR